MWQHSMGHLTRAGTSCRCVALVGVLKGERTLSPYTTMVGAEALAAVTCEPGTSSTDPAILSMLLGAAADLGHHLFSLFVHPARTPRCPSPIA